MFIVKKAWNRIARRAGLALALVATSLVQLQPICAAADVRGTSSDQAALSDQAKDAGGSKDGNPDHSCCLALDAAAVLSAVNPPSSEAQAISLPPQPAFVMPAHGTPHAHKPGLAVVSLFPTPRYHARSARIQR